MPGGSRIVDHVDPESSETGQSDLSQNYSRFMFTKGVEPADNHTEQQVRGFRRFGTVHWGPDDGS